MTPDDETEATGPAPTAYSGSSKQGDSAPRPIVAVTARVESIVDAAEQVAREIRVEAESDALIYAQTKRDEVDRMIAAHHKELADLCGALTRQTEALQKEISNLAAQIEGLVPQAAQAPAATTPGPLPPADEPRSGGRVGDTDAAGQGAQAAAVQGSTPAMPDQSGSTPHPAQQSSAPPASPVAAGKAQSSAPADDADAADTSSERPRPRFAVPFRREKAAPSAEPQEEAPASDEDQPTSRDASGPAPPMPADRRDPDAAILMATQMAVAGSSRAEVRTALLREFDLGDTERAMLEVLGPEGLN